jgi:hypothetical protein|tara:strand:+ start:16898 stop:19828 length:2931 start_codon:yes stop_codon:yes gene_type:complete
MKLKLSLLVLFVLTVFSVKAQDRDGEKPTFIGKALSMQHVPSISSQTNLPPARTKEREMNDARSSKNNVIPGKDPQTENDYFVRNPHRLAGKIPGKEPSLVFDAASSNSSPTDPALAVGPDHVFVVFNTGFIIYDKAGNALTNQIAPNPTIFPNGGCCDLTVSYDNAADRWVITFLGAGAQVAVSDGPDPVNDGWYTYTIPSVNDYQKLSVWSDGYYITDNTSNANNRIYALERDAMLAGDPNAQIIGFPLPGIETSGFYSPQAINVTDDNLPAAGSAPIVYLQDDAWGGVSEDHVKLWTVDVDWDTPGNSSISQPNELVTTPFISVFDGGSFSNLTQPGGGIAIDALQATIMNQAQFRKFSGHNSAVFNFVVDTDASGGELAGIRWFELRQSGDGQPWTIHQEGTYTSPDGKHAWHGSMMMDLQGNIGMGYTAMAGPDTPNPTDFRVSSYYTGRFASDPLNTMTVSEELIAAGNQNIPGLRYGDYSKIDLDPNNDKEFWFINEYMNSGRKDVVGVFQIAPNFNDDVGVVSIDEPVTGTLSASEEVTVTIFNFGQNAASNFDVTFQVDGGAVVTETFAGPLASATSTQYTFTATADLSTVGQTYSITASTDYSADEDNTNDATTKEVTYLEPNDIGVTAITSPNSGENLSASETVSVTINNFGGEPQSNFDVSYDVNGTVVTETVAGPLNGNSQMSYTFTETADLSAFGTYNFTATTSLAGDSDTSNDETTKVVVNVNCQPQSNCTLGDGIRLVQLGDIDNPSGCDPNGYGDYTNLSTDLEIDTTNDLTITTEYGNQFVRVWIDFNDDFVFTTDELVVDNYEIADEQGAGTYTETMDLVVPADAALGQHLMRIKTNWNNPVPNDACEETTYGETEDYMVNIFDPLGVNDNPFAEAEFTVLKTGKNIYDVSLDTQSVTGKLELSVYNVLGQRLVYRVLENEGNGYNHQLNMTYVQSGVYLVKLGNGEIGKVKRIVVE